MRTYRVTMVETIVLSTTVDAEDAEEALELALNKSDYHEESMGTSEFRVYDYMTDELVYEPQKRKRRRGQ